MSTCEQSVQLTDYYRQSCFRQARNAFLPPPWEQRTLSPDQIRTCWELINDTVKRNMDTYTDWRMKRGL